MAQTLLSSSSHQHYSRNFSSGLQIETDASQDAKQFEHNLLTFDECADSFQPILTIPDTFQHSRKRSQSCHPQIHRASKSISQTSTSPISYCPTLTTGDLAHADTNQWLNSPERSARQTRAMAERTIIVVEEVEMSSEEDSDLGTTHSPIGLLFKNGRLQPELRTKIGSGTSAYHLPSCPGVENFIQDG